MYDSAIDDEVGGGADDQDDDAAEAARAGPHPNLKPTRNRRVIFNNPRAGSMVIWTNNNWNWNHAAIMNICADAPKSR
ncbi:hypothetical protein [Enterobacter roggenkampii]|uniref:hypothetical protein n=1 Tax=Enterobacter roggenkampii TaxID=1812935 RepID=UPI003CC915F4